MNTTHQNDAQTQIELFISCRKLKNKDTMSKSDPKVKAYLQVGEDNNHTILVGETEEIKDNLNPDFKTTIKVDYIFESKQVIKFTVFDEDGKGKEEHLGTVVTEVGKLVGAKDQVTTLDLDDKGKPGGKIIIRVDNTNIECNQFVQW